MRNLLFLIIWVLVSIVVISCGSSNNDDLGNNNHYSSCNESKQCGDGLICIDTICKTEEEACKYITCVGDDGKSHGYCKLEEEGIACDCDDGYERYKDLRCNSIEASNICEVSTCVGKNGSKCILEAGKAKCICKDGYEEDSEGDCIANVEYFCEGVICDENKNMTGLCKIKEVEYDESISKIETYCECEDGWQGDNCDESTIPDCSICENDSKATGVCRVDPQDLEQRVICECEEGYSYDPDIGCIADSENKSLSKEVNRSFKGGLNQECFKNSACLSGLICENNKCLNAPKISPKTIIVTKEESNDELIEVSENKLVFLKNERTMLFKKGYILAFKETTLFENGFIGKIEKIEKTINRIIITTKEVSPFEILGNTSLKIDENIYFDKPISPNVSNADRFIDYSLNYDKSLYRDSFKIKGSMSIHYNFKMFIDIKKDVNRYSLTKFDMLNEIELTNDLNLNINAISFTNEKIKIRFQGVDLFSKQKISTFTVYLPYGIKTKGEVYLTVRALYSGNLQGKAEVKIKTKSSIKSGIKYENNETTRTSDNNTEKLSLDENIKMDGRAGITFKVTPEVHFSAYSTAVTNNVIIGTEIIYTQALLNSTIETNTSPKSCYTLEGIGSLNSYSNLDMMTSYQNGVKTSNGINFRWDKDASPINKNFNWINNKCENFSCDEANDCHINQKTMADTCDRGTCSSSNSSSDYDFVEIPEGDFIRGCVEGDENCKNDETPAKTVHLTAYKIGKKEVTVSQYKACVDSGSCIAPESGNYVEDGRDNHPINSVSWVDAQRFCSWLGGSQKFIRLPTEAEWENAAKGGGNPLYPWGDAEPSCDLIQRESEDGIDGCGDNSTAEVGTKLGDYSGYGVMDMAGNVTEFTGDYYSASYYSDENSLNNPKGPIAPTDSSTFIVLHGGDWKTHKDTSFRNSRRLALQSTVKANNIGFRCVYKEETNEIQEGEGTVDSPIELGTLNPGYSHNDSRDTNDAISTYFDKYPSDTTNEYGKEFIYHFNNTEKIKITLYIDEPEPSGTDIDLHLFKNLSATNPGLVKRDDKKIEVVIEPGDYYISMDSYGRSGNTKEGVYNLHIKVENVTVGDCSNISLIELDTASLPYTKTETKDTKNASNDCFDMYKPYTQSEKGKEYVYHFKITEKVNAKFYIDSPEPNGTDIDLHLFKTLDSENLGMIKRDDKSISTSLEAGEYYLSLDSYSKNGVDKEGNYKLTIELKKYSESDDEDGSGGTSDATLHPGKYLNPYLLAAVKYMDSNYHRKGYYLNANYTHNLYYKGKGSNGVVKMTGPINSNTGTRSYTQCVGAVHEALLIAIKNYSVAANDSNTYSHFTATKWFGKMMSVLYQMSNSSGSKGITTHISTYKMGKVLSKVSEATPGTAIHIDRAKCNGSGGGHSVIFISFIDKYGNEYTKYPSDKKIVGFKYISANGSSKNSSKGVYAKYAILYKYLKKPSGSCTYKPNLTELSKFCKSHECDTWKGGAVRVLAGDYYIPKYWPGGTNSSSSSVKFTSSIKNVPTSIIDKMRGVSWKPGIGCTDPKDLRYLKLSYYNMIGKVAIGEIIVNKKVAKSTVKVFEKLFNDKFNIEKMVLMYNYSGNDDLSMRDNNTSGYNCRLKTNGTTLSNHSFGKAIDVNPKLNPMVTRTSVYPSNGAKYKDRTLNEPGMIKKGDTTYKAFINQGWKWGGNWHSSKDYQHFEKK